MTSIRRGIMGPKSGSFLMDEGHVYIGNGLVYCPRKKDSAPPKTTHSRVICELCGATIQSAVNPKKKRRKNPDPHFAVLRAKWIRQGLSEEDAEKLAMQELQDGRKKNPSAAVIRDAAQGLVKQGIVDSATARELISKTLTFGIDKLPSKQKDLLNFALGFSRGKNPRRGPVKIYGKTEKIFMEKTTGPYKGEKFVHDFKGGVEQYGFPRGSVITTPDGKAHRLTTRSVLLTGPKDIWRHFNA